MMILFLSYGIMNSPDGPGLAQSQPLDAFGLAGAGLARPPAWQHVQP